MVLETSKNRYFRILVTGLLLLAFFPFCCAYADDYEGGGGGSHVIGGSYPAFGTVWYDDSPRYGVVAYTNYDAALYNLGYNDGDKDFNNLFTPAKKVKLIGSSNAFKTFADKFKTGKPETTGSSLNLWEDFPFISAWNSARDLYGETYCYSTSDLTGQAAARRFVDSILSQDDEDDEGGADGGPSGSSDSMSYFKVTPWAEQTNLNIDYVGIKTSLVEAAQSYAAEHSQAILIRVWPYSSTTWGVAMVTAAPDNVTWFAESTPESGGNSYTCKWNTGFNTYEVVLYTSDKGTYNGKPALITGVGSGGVQYYPPVVVGACPIIYRNWGDAGPSTGGGGDVPVDPPVTWPDPPTNPTVEPPDVPGPPDPHEPVDPTPPTPWEPIPGIGIQITGDDFQDLLDALDEHCKHLQQSITSNIGQLWNNQSELLSTGITDIRNDIGNGFSGLNNYLNELFEWLKENLNLNVNVEGNSYDDSSIIYWLKRINSKLGAGDIVTEPTDPVANPTDWWSWLLALMHNFVAMLLAFGSDRLGDVTTAVNTLTSKFPFSLPWDLAAMFMLLDAPPVIPAFDLPCFALTTNGLSEVGQYHITLEAFDGVWEGIRWVERLAFIVMLIRNTDRLMSVMRRAVGR